MKTLNKITRPIIAIVVVFLTVTIFTNWSSSNKKDEEQKILLTAKTAEVKTTYELNQVMKDSIQQLKNESKENNKTYKNNITKYKAIIANNKKEAKIKNEKKMAEIAQKNNEMIIRVNNYKDADAGKDNYELYRYELSREMDDISKSLTVSNI